MEAEEREEFLKQSHVLRQELKAWERDFAATNGGRKAGRDDIKQHPAIAQKYKDYSRSRDMLSGKATSQVPSSPQKRTSRKRKLDEAQVQAPPKRLQISKTPSKNTSHPAFVDPYDSPSLIRNLFTPSSRFIGPTPQKDGQVLGLFDLLPDENEESPSKGQISIAGPDGQMQATPRRPNSLREEVPGTIRPSRTPASSGKRFMLDSFATPLKRHPNEQSGKTPLSVSKLRFSTPSFLRRDSHRSAMPAIEETTDGIILSPQMPRLPKKPLVRGLSSMLAGLRRMEEDAADEDLGALHDMEKETHGPNKSANRETVLVEDSQVPLLLGGLDDEAKYDSEPEEVKNPNLGRDGQSRKTWKKKGQKRTTRRVTMKPVRSKPQPQPITQALPENGEGEGEGQHELAGETEKAVLETQPQHPETDSQFFAEAGNFDSDSGSEYTASEGGTRYRRPNQEKKTKKKKGAEGRADGKVKAAARKVGAMAHANFKKLKLRNSGAKGGAAHNSRFRRKR